MQRKTSILKFPTDKRFIKEFILGYFDGDGSLWINKAGDISLSIEGNEKFLKKLRDRLLEATNIKYTKIYSDKRSKNWSFKKQGLDALRILRYLYSTQVASLRRKAVV